LDPLQYALWERAEDDARIAEQIAKAVAGTIALPHQQSQTSADQIELIKSTERAGLPLLTAEPILDVIALSADNPFYVKRQVDDLFYDSLRWDNGAATLYAPRQMGKSSLFARVRARLEREQMKSVFIDLKMLAAEGISEASKAFVGIGESIAEQLKINDDPASFFAGRGFVGSKLQRFLTEAVAPVAERVVLLFDDIDSVFEASYRDAFFGSLRAVIDQKAIDPALRRVGFGFAHSHDPGLWITAANQSPFSVATKFLVPEFTETEVNWLHQQHAGPLSPLEARELFAILGGHPYLTRLALYRISTQKMTFAEIKREAATDEGVFGDHLRGRLMTVINSGLSKPLKSVLDRGKCADILEFQRLLAMGLVKGDSHKNARARFGLYHDYFKERLDA
jgi:hypothetical protein